MKKLTKYNLRKRNYNSSFLINNHYNIKDDYIIGKINDDNITNIKKSDKFKPKIQFLLKKI